MKSCIEDQEMTINSALYILNALGGRSDFHKLFKILYFADQKHLIRYGGAFSGDFYVAMKHGPVPSDLYDILKCVREEGKDEYKAFFSVQQTAIVSAAKGPDLDVLSETNVECLNESIEENKRLSFNDLTEKSHGKAWEAAKEQTDVIDFLDIASEGGADEEMLKYIEIKQENQNLLSYAVF